MTNTTLYLKIDQNVEVHNNKVYLGDIAQLECTDAKKLNRLKTLKILSIKDDKKGRYPVSVIKVITVIHEIYPDLDVNNVGETDFIITYEKDKHMHNVYSWLKTIFVCLIMFFGSAFSIMTFNNDVDIPALFGQLYQEFTGKVSNGNTILEITYSIGVGVGVLVYFNHFGKKKLTSDPTPIEVEMRLYENDVNTTLIEEGARKERNQNVD